MTKVLPLSRRGATVAVLQPTDVPNSVCRPKHPSSFERAISADPKADCAIRRKMQRDVGEGQLSGESVFGRLETQLLRSTASLE